MKQILIVLMFASMAQASLIVLPSPAPTTPPTVADMQAQVKTGIQQVITQNLNVIYQSFARVDNMMWKHPKLTPQQTFAALSTDCVAFLTINGQLSAAINSIPGVPANFMNFTAPAGWTIAPQQDGSCTLAYVAPSPAPQMQSKKAK